MNKVFQTIIDRGNGKTGKLFTKAEWDNTTEEERDLNTHKVSD